MDKHWRLSYNQSSLWHIFIAPQKGRTSMYDILGLGELLIDFTLW